MGLEVLPVGVGLVVDSPVPLTPAGIASSHQAPCVWPRPRSVTAASTDARPATLLGPPLGATTSRCKVGPSWSPGFHPWPRLSLCLSQAFSVLFPLCRLGPVTSSWEPSRASSPPLHPAFLQPCLSPSLAPYSCAHAWDALRTEGRAQGRPRSVGA